MDSNSSQYIRRTVEIRVGGRYRLGKKIGAGAFGEIYEGTDIFGGGDVAIKLEHGSLKYPQLLFEAKLLKTIPGNGIPQMFWFGVAGEYNTMVMDLLGQNLEDLFNFCTRNFTLKTILLIAMEFLDRIKHVHDNHFVHRDIKPENFLAGKAGANSEQTIYLIDFGLAKRYRDEQTRIHIGYKENKNLTGTARYASRNAHKGAEQSRRDDLESIGYVLIYFLKGSLPWQGLKCKDKTEKYQKIREMKEQMTPKTLCEGLPQEFSDYLEYCQNLKFDEEPNYKYLMGLFKDFYKSKDYENDYMYDWVTVKNNTKVLKDASICHSDEYSKAQNQIDNKNKGKEL
jgi:serine/threonine protein kinase